MKKNIALQLFMAALLVSPSCTKEDDNLGDATQTDLFSPSISAVQSSASLLKSSFESGDEISLFAWTAAQGDDVTLTEEEFLIFNMQLTYDGSQWGPLESEDIDDEISECVVAGVYPSQFMSSSIEDLQAIDVDIESPMIYFRQSAEEWSGSLAPTFNNVLSQLNFNVTGSAQTSATMSVKGAISVAATLDLLSGVLTPASAETTTVSFAQNEISANLYSSLIIPQTITSFTITLSGSTYEYDGEGITLEAGDAIIQNISLTTPEVEGEIGEIVLGSQFDISEWEELADANGEFNFNE